MNDTSKSMYRIFISDEPFYMFDGGTFLMLKCDGNYYTTTSSYTDYRWNNNSFGSKHVATAGSSLLGTTIPIGFNVLYITFDLCFDTGEIVYDWQGNNGPAISILKPTGSYETGLNIAVPYDFGLLNARYTGNLVVGIDKNNVVGKVNVVEKTIPYNDITKISFTGGLNASIEKASYTFYVKYQYMLDGVAKEVIQEQVFNGGINENQLGGQDVVTGNESYNKILKFTSPESGKRYDYGQPESFNITADKSFYDTDSKMPLEQYLPPVPEKTGNYQFDAIAMEARGMVYIVENGELNTTLKV
jgi:hypothetical protein